MVAMEEVIRVSEVRTTDVDNFFPSQKSSSTKFDPKVVTDHNPRPQLMNDGSILASHIRTVDGWAVSTTDKAIKYEKSYVKNELKAFLINLKVEWQSP